ncbi:MAG TPA: alpha/beta fold hydrolase [Chloroflexia bacterium]|nr:alpha/beta fold hydrolase [Chloroflexia bacterium]
MGESWLARVEPKSQARLRLFCFPYAGGRASIFRAWQANLPPAVEVFPIEFPGRGMRFAERLHVQLTPLVREIASEIQPYMDRPFALFGHSMGALVSFELARELQSTYGLSPAHLFVSAHRAPHLPDTSLPMHTLSDPDLLQRLHGLNGTPGELLQEPDLMKLTLPIVRADFSVCETYAYAPGAALTCPISTFGGWQDVMVTRDQLEAWGQHTHASFELHMLPGEHFFLHTAQSLVLRILSQELAQIVAGTAP